MHGQGPWLFLTGLGHCWLWGAPTAPSTLLHSWFSLNLFSKVSALLLRHPSSQSRLLAHRSSLFSGGGAFGDFPAPQKPDFVLGPSSQAPLRPLHTHSWLLPKHPSHLPRPPLCRLSSPGSAGEQSSLSGNIPSTCLPDESPGVLTSESPCQTSCSGMGGSVARVS